MFMLVTYPWPSASAYVELTGPQPIAASATRAGAAEQTTPQSSRHVEEIFSWTNRERLRFQWYRLRLAGNRRRARPS